MADVAELEVIISADTRRFDAGIRHVEQQTKGLGDSVAKGIGMGTGLAVLEKGIGAIGAAFSLAKGSVIDLNSSLEQSRIAFTTMLGSVEKADEFLGSLSKFAAETPFEFPDLVQASKRMFAFGFESKQVIPLLTAVGDAVAAVGGGADVIDGVTTALGQMQAKGKVSAEEMNQLAERGIPAWDMLAKKMGKSVAETMDLASKGQIKSETMLAAFQEGVATRFGGMMAKQARTWQGALSTISDSVQMSMARAFKPFFDLLSSGAIAAADFLSGAAFAAWADEVAASMADLVAEGVELTRWLVASLAPAWGWVLDHGAEIKAVFLGAATAIGALVAAGAVVPIISAVGGALMALLSPIALVAAAGAALALAWQTNWLGIRDTTATVASWLVTTAWPGLQAAMAAVATWITTTLVPTFALVVSTLWDKVGVTLTWLTTTGWPTIQAAMTTVSDWIAATLVPTLTSVWTWLTDKVGAALTWLTEKGWPLLGNAANAVQNWVKDTLIPTLTEWYQWFDQKLQIVYQWFIATGWPKLQEAGAAVWTWLTTSLFPALSDWWDWFQKRLSPIFAWFIDYGWPTLMTAGATVVSWLTTSLFPTLSDWWDWLQARLSPVFTWFIDYGWPSLTSAGSAFASWITGSLVPALSEWWSWLGDRAHSAADWWINVGFPGLAKGARDQNVEVKAAGQFWKDFTAELSKTDAAESWVTILENLSKFGHYLVSNVNLAAWFDGIAGSAEGASGWAAYFAEFVAWIGRQLAKWSSYLPGTKAPPEMSEPPSRPSGGGGGGGGGFAPGTMAPPARGTTPAPSPAPAPAPSPSPSPSPAPAPAPEPAPAPAPTPPPGGAQPGMPSDTAGWIALTRSMGQEYGLGEWFVSQIRQESGFNPNALSGAGARGIGQFMPATGAAVAAQLGVSTAAFWADPRLQLRGAALHMRDLTGRYGGDTIAGLVGYNAGTGNADYLRPFLGNVPAELRELESWRDQQPRHYIRAILGMARGGMISEPILGMGRSGQMYAFGEQGPEYVLPQAALRRSGGPLMEQTVRIDVAVGGRLAEEIYVTGRDLAIRRGRAPAGAA